MAAKLIEDYTGNHCFWCGGKLTRMKQFKEKCENCNLEAHTPEEYIAMKKGRKPKLENENEDESLADLGTSEE